MPTEDRWLDTTLDVDAYLARIGIRDKPIGRAGLDALHEAHVRAFTFDNIDVLLDQHPGVAVPDVAAKMVARGRGGYCFEHATLFAAALTSLGYAVERRLGRVGDPHVAARSHCSLVVTVPGEPPLLADPGFAMSVLRPIPLVDSAEDDHGGWRYRVTRSEDPVLGGAWELSRWHSGRWDVMHTTDDLPVQPTDLVMANHYTSTYPPVRFRNELFLTRHQPGRHTTLTHEAVTIRRPGEPTQHRPLGLDEVDGWLDELGVEISPDERSRLLERLRTLRAGT